MYSAVFPYLLGAGLAALSCTTARFMPPRAERALFTGIMMLVAVSFAGFPLEVGHHQGTVNELLAGMAFAGLIGLSLRWPLLLSLTFFLHGAWDLGYLMGVVESFKPDWVVQLCVPYDWIVAAYIWTRASGPWAADAPAKVSPVSVT